MSVRFYTSSLPVEKRGRVTIHDCPAGVPLMKMLRIHLEDALEWTCCALLSGDSSQSSSPASAGMAAGTDDEIKCSPSPRAGSSIPTSLGRLSNERARICRAKETRRSVASPDKSVPWRQHYRDALLPLVPGLGRAGAEGLQGLLKQMCFVMGIVKTKRERKNCLVSKFQLEIHVQSSRYDGSRSDVQLI